MAEFIYEPTYKIQLCLIKGIIKGAKTLGRQE